MDLAQAENRSVRARLTEILWPQCKWALLSAALGQLKSGDITMVEWLRVAGHLCLHLLTSSPPVLALRRIGFIARIPFQIYSPSYFLSLGDHQFLNTAQAKLQRPGRPRRVPGNPGAGH